MPRKKLSANEAKSHVLNIRMDEYDITLLDTLKRKWNKKSRAETIRHALEVAYKMS